jgi:uncharacterized protein
MYFAVVQQFIRTLNALDHLLGKAVAHADAKKFNVDNFMTARIAPDMLPFPFQVRVACDTAKRATAMLTGKEAPVHEDSEKTVAELRERIQKCLGFLKSFKDGDFKSVDPKATFKLQNPAGKAMHIDDALITRSVPNFYFHVSMAYALLRAGGVDVGKYDFFGDLPMFDAAK